MSLPGGSHLLQGRSAPFLLHPNSEAVVPAQSHTCFPTQRRFQNSLSNLSPPSKTPVCRHRPPLCALQGVPWTGDPGETSHLQVLLGAWPQELLHIQGRSLEWCPPPGNLGLVSHRAAYHPWVLYLQLHFIGVTVRLEQKYVHFTSTTHQFIPVPIGDSLPPRQVSVSLSPRGLDLCVSVSVLTGWQTLPHMGQWGAVRTRLHSHAEVFSPH